jgi:soluble lytic murein transglycosylase-like protein
MTQVTNQGLLQAFFFLAIVFAAVVPQSISVGELPYSAEQLAQNRQLHREATIKARLTTFIVSTYKQKPVVAKRIVDSAYKESVRTNLSPLLILAIIAQESSFQPKAESSYGAQGLMQVVARIHSKEVALLPHPAKLWHPESNIATGSGILKRYLKSADGNLDQALTRYSGNATSYAARVRGHWAKLRHAIAHPQSKAFTRRSS